MAKPIVIATLSGPITVAYRKRKRPSNWICTALEFDLAGIGKTKQEAFLELQNVIATYMEQIMNSKPPVEFYHPAEADDWNLKDKKRYHVVVELVGVVKEIPIQFTDIDKFRESYGNRIKNYGLVPVSV